METMRTLNGTALEAEVGDHVRQAEAQKYEVTELVEGLTQEQFDWRPGAAKWSVGEHVAHLAMATTRYLEAMVPSIESARRSGRLSPGPYRHGWLGNWFVRAMEPPPGMRVRTFRSLEPPRQRPRSDVLQDFLGAQDRMITALRAANGVDLAGARFRSPFLRLLRLTVGQGFSAILAHNRRHLWHIRQVVVAPGFPGG